VIVCNLVPQAEAQIRNPSTRPTVGIVFGIIGGLCGSHDDRLAPVRQLVNEWRQTGARVYLVPYIPQIVPTPENLASFPDQVADYQAIARQDPSHISVVDAGVFVRDGTGHYQWRMPCVPRGEYGCERDHTIPVRYFDGFHFCADPHFDGTHCGPRFRGGVRRVASAIAAELLAPSTKPSGGGHGTS
jgi:hypothetical protein